MGLLFAAGGRAALAQVDLLSSETLHGVVDVRASAADGEPSFDDGGFGKFRNGGAPDGGYQGRLQVAEGALEWTPRLGWEWSAVVDAGYQPGQEHVLDLYQAYLAFKPVPRSATRFSARIGHFYPPISLEHDARVWGLTNTITPSAINSWVGEELKVTGGDATISRDFGGQSLAVTAGLFGFDDTAGTLLAFRGWALHDLKSQADGDFRLPPLSPMALEFQAGDTYSTLEIDGRAGYYAKLEWRPTADAGLEALYYDNRGNGSGVTPDLQWAWATSFTAVGAYGQLGEHTRVLAQGLVGRTWIGHPDFRLTDVSFRSAYVMVTHDLGKDAVSARADIFQTADNRPLPPADLGEHGWALTGAWRHPINKILDFRLEAAHIDSVRPSRVLAGQRPRQAQDLFQSSLRMMF
jgi:hypothetical protein